VTAWMPETRVVAPAAEAARSLLRTATTLALHLPAVPGLVVVGGHAADREGRLLLPTSADDRVVEALRRSPLPARAVLTDVAPLPLRSRWRGRLELQGRLSQVPADDAEQAWRQAGGGALAPERRVLRLAPRILRLTRLPDRPVEVCPRAYAQAEPDPVAGLEAELLSHLANGHPEQVLQLAGLLPRRTTAGARRVVPLRLDRRALVLRVEREHDDLDVPLALASARARHPGEVVAALRALLDTCPRRARAADETQSRPGSA
jgi:hypothetical protein